MKKILFKRFLKTNLLPKVFIYLAALLFTVLPVSSAYADTFTFQPTPANLYNLDHTYAYSWGINWSQPVGQTITEAYITFKNINNWDNNANILYVNLLDSVSGGVSQFGDNPNDNYFSNYFSGTGFQLGTYSDTNGIGQTDTVTFSIPATQYSWLSSGSGNGGNFGFGIDPDCHFNNSGITMTIKTTHSVPEPSSLLLICLGLVGLMVYRRSQQEEQNVHLPYRWQMLSEV